MFKAFGVFIRVSFAVLTLLALGSHKPSSRFKVVVLPKNKPKGHLGS